jgi:drug/metabolite transporter (DMT)-like permease
VAVRRSYLMLSGVTAGWGTIPVLAGLVHLPSALIVASRLWTAAICLGGAVWWRRRRDRRLSRVAMPALFSFRPARCACVAGVLAVHWLALFAAYHRAPAGTVILIVYLAPIGVAAVAPRLLGERLGRRTIAALVAATAGFALVAGPTVRSAGATGLVLSLIAAVLFVFLIVLSKPLAEVYGGLQLAFIEMAGAGLVLIPVAVLTHWPHPAPSWLWLLVLGVVHTGVGISIYLAALADLPATHVGILGYLEPVGVVLCAWAFLGQRPAVETVLGGILVVGAGVTIVAFGHPDRAGEAAAAIPGAAGPGVPSHP